MNFLLVFFSVLMKCIRYKITHSDYDCIMKLIPNLNKTGVYNGIINNPDFLCLIELNEETEHWKEIKIIKLDNIDPETGNNIIPALFCEISDINHLVLSNLKLSRLPNQFEEFQELEFLDLSNNKFKEFPQVIFSLPKLKVLYLYNNEFVTISSEIVQMNSQRH